MPTYNMYIHSCIHVFHNVKLALLHVQSIMLCTVYTDPNSAIHFSYRSKSEAETDLEHFLMAEEKSSMVVGSSSSSLARFLISSGLLPSMRRRIAIIDASLNNQREYCHRGGPTLPSTPSSFSLPRPFPFLLLLSPPTCSHTQGTKLVRENLQPFDS